MHYVVREAAQGLHEALRGGHRVRARARARVKNRF